MLKSYTSKSSSKLVTSREIILDKGKGSYWYFINYTTVALKSHLRSSCLKMLTGKADTISWFGLEVGSPND